MKHILFVCTGNTCRSAMAEALFKKILKDNSIEGVNVSSTGVAVFTPSPASGQAISVMKEKGIDLTSHQSKQVTQEMIEQADYIFTMTASHRESLLRECPIAADKAFTLKEFTTENDEDVYDPFGFSKAAYATCAKEIGICLEQLLYKLKKELSS